jgi:hypothetical protein
MGDMHMGFPEHQAAVLTSEGQRQSDMTVIRINGEGSLTTIIGPTGPTPINGSQMATRAANIAHYRRCLASANANGISPAPYASALRELGTGGI